MGSKYIIETNGTVRECLHRCLDAGCIPLTLGEVKQAMKEGKLSKNRWYDTSTIRLEDGTHKDATMQELQDILSGKLSGALLVNYLVGYSNADGLNNLDDGGSFVRHSSPTKKSISNPALNVKGVEVPDYVENLLSLGEGKECEKPNFNPSLKEVCLWWIHTYPKDVFTGKTKDSKGIVAIRKEMEKLLRKMK